MSTPSKSAVLLQLTLQSIVNGDIDKLKHYLYKMPLAQLSPADFSSLLQRFLSVCAENQQTTLVAPILEAFDATYPEENEKIDFFASLFLNPTSTLPVLKFVTSTKSDTSFMDVIDELMEMDDRESLITACQRVLQSFGDQTRSIYESLANDAVTRDNTVIANFMQELLEATNPYAEIPEWVIPPTDKEIVIPEYEPPSFELPSIDDAVNMLTDGLQNVGITIEAIDEAKEVLRARLSIATLDEKMKLLQPILEKEALAESQSNILLFQLLGPANPFYNSQIDDLEYGGSRMFIATDFDYDEETGFVEDWFDGTCWQCRNRILRRWHAIRIPQP